MSKTVVIEFRLLFSFRNLSINHINKKLHSNAGLKTMNGKNKLAPVIYIKAGKKLGLAKRLWLLIILLKIKACVNTKIPAKNILAEEENTFSKLTLISNLAKGSRKSKFS
ncbi:hypothetical protein GCM10008119_31250 [Pedobacter mendelii]|uniref:Uncharacterized protein n=1 Tax=Pedobacter mendelii TaxID=1908240 RepID=A0ABQ2BLR7_9SPHI|nr:hypothetical protein GCM10008119_31250 [Pedobacter mendelii]